MGRALDCDFLASCGFATTRDSTGPDQIVEMFEAQASVGGAGVLKQACLEYHLTSLRNPCTISAKRHEECKKQNQQSPEGDDVGHSKCDPNCPRQLCKNLALRARVFHRITNAQLRCVLER
eukprot:5541047-Amphidinium_carterae.3